MTYVGRHLKVGAYEAAVLCGHSRERPWAWAQRWCALCQSGERRWRRATRRRDLTTCEACLVELDRLLELGLAKVHRDGQVDCGVFFARVRSDRSTMPHTSLDLVEANRIFREIYGGAALAAQINALPVFHWPLGDLTGVTYSATQPRPGSPGWLSRGENNVQLPRAPRWCKPD